MEKTKDELQEAIKRLKEKIETSQDNFFIYGWVKQIEGYEVKLAKLLREAEKYKWFKNHEENFGYTVVHVEDDVETLIALTDNAEKAHFIARACNQLET